MALKAQVEVQVAKFNKFEWINLAQIMDIGSGDHNELKTSDIYYKLLHCIQLRKAREGKCPQNKTKLNFSLARQTGPQSYYEKNTYGLFKDKTNSN